MKSELQTIAVRFTKNDIELLNLAIMGGKGVTKSDFLRQCFREKCNALGIRIEPEKTQAQVVFAAE